MDLEIIIEEHDGLLPDFGQWCITAKHGNNSVGFYYINFKKKPALYIHDSRIISNIPSCHIPRCLIQECSSFLFIKAKELLQPITHTVRFHHEETRNKLQPIFQENKYVNQGRSNDCRYDWVMVRIYSGV